MHIEYCYQFSPSNIFNLLLNLNYMYEYIHRISFEYCHSISKIFVLSLHIQQLLSVTKLAGKARISLQMEFGIMLINSSL